MDNQDLTKLIETLYAEIQKAQTINQNDRERLARLETEIRGFLEKAGESGGTVHPTAFKRLQEELNQFESSHPILTSLVAQILDALSGIGI